MKIELEKLVESLREELMEYGELHALLEQQQNSIVSRSVTGLLENLGAIDAQVSVVSDVRRHRDELRMNLAKTVGQPASVSFERLTGHLPEEYQSLVRALVEDINAVLHGCQQRLRQNHYLLGHSLDSVHQILFELFSFSKGKTYNRTGAALSGLPVSSPLCEAVV